MLSSTLYAIFVVFTLFSVVLSSDITTYTDGKCTKSFNNLDAVNGYPDGVCTPLNLSDKTFQIAKLDPGCAVTLYGANSNELSCSSDLKIVAELATCYNSSWAYYSIDGCLPPSSTTIVLPKATAKRSSSAISISYPSVTPVSASPSSSPPASNSNHTGAVVGGVVGGVSGFALVFGATLFYLRRRNRSKPLPPPPSYELPNDNALLEAANTRFSYPEKVAQSEIWGRKAIHEMGRNSVYVPPAELPGDFVVGDDKKGVQSLVKMHVPR